MARSGTVALVLALAWSTGCTSATSLLVGREDPGVVAGSGGSVSADAGRSSKAGYTGYAGSVASDPSVPLSLHIESNRVAIEKVALTCSANCVDLEAVTTGGAPPYAFFWDDGTTSAARRVCPTSTTVYRVSVTAPNGVGGVVETASAQLTVEVPPCPRDAGVDAPPSSGNSICLKNPSLEGTPPFGPLPDWDFCQGTADLGPGYSKLMPTNGETYAGLLTITGATTLRVLQGNPCSPLRAGHSVPFSIDLTMSSAFGPFGSAFLQVWGATASCAPDELLWASPLIDQFDQWNTYCGVLAPSKDYAYLIVAASTTNGGTMAQTASGGYLLLDNIGSTGTCTR